MLANLTNSHLINLISIFYLHVRILNKISFIDILGLLAPSCEFEI